MQPAPLYASQDVLGQREVVVSIYNSCGVDSLVGGGGLYQSNPV
jgi:hypothetical protein